MAIAKEIWNKAKAYYEAGLSLSQIKEKTGIARNTISQRAKREQWEHHANAEYIEAKQIVAEKKGTILEQKGQVFLNIADEVAEDKIRRKNLVYGNAEKLAAKLNTMSDQVEDPQDLRHLVEANDKLAITLKVADRHAPKTDINLTQQQGIQIEEKKKTLADYYDDVQEAINE